MVTAINSGTCDPHTYLEKSMKKIIVNSLCALSLALGSGSSMAGESVNIGAPSWTGAQAIAALLQAVVVERIGGEANLVPGNNATIFQGAF